MSRTTSTSTALAPAPEVATTAGRVRGRWRPGSAAFFGIPFAAPPVGPDRFAAPRRPKAWEGVRPATDHGPTAQRRPFGLITTIPEPSIPGDETLNVDVFTPAPADTRAGLPVFVWIHGGGFFAGSPASPWYDGRSFNRDGVVTVTISYRLGFDGFGWIDGAPLNRGVLDQLAALEWVHENIRGFGGDPDRVTIGGQSAGGGSVLALLTSPRSRGLFSQAVAHSASLGRVRQADAEAAGRRFAAALGIRPDLDSWRAIPEDAILDRERVINDLSCEEDALSIASAIESVRHPESLRATRAFQPVIDGVAVVDVRDGMSRGCGSHVPLLLGATRNEFGLALDRTEHEVVAELHAAGVSDRSVRRFRHEVARIGTQFAMSQFLVSIVFRVPAVCAAAARRRGGAGARTWLFDFATRSSLSGTAPHCTDLPFAWDLLDADGVAEELGTDAPQAVADRMHGDWVRFVDSGTAPWSPVGDAPSGAMAYGSEGDDAGAPGVGAARFDPDAFLLDAEIAGLAGIAGIAGIAAPR